MVTTTVIIVITTITVIFTVLTIITVTLALLLFRFIWIFGSALYTLVIFNL